MPTCFPFIYLNSWSQKLFTSPRGGLIRVVPPMVQSGTPGVCGASKTPIGSLRYCSIGGRYQPYEKGLKRAFEQFVVSIFEKGPIFKGTQGSKLVFEQSSHNNWRRKLKIFTFWFHQSIKTYILHFLKKFIFKGTSLRGQNLKI